MMRLYELAMAGIVFLCPILAPANPIPLPPVSESLLIEISPTTDSLRARVSGSFDLDFSVLGGDSITTLSFPVPPGSQILHVIEDYNPVDWDWQEGWSYPTILPQMPFLPAIEWDCTPTVPFYSLYVEYEHDLLPLYQTDGTTSPVIPWSSPRSSLISRVWARDQATIGANETSGIHGIGFDGQNVIICGSNPRQIAVVSPDDGSHLDNITLQATDPYGMNPSQLNLDHWLGPYDIATRIDDAVFLYSYIQGAPITRLDSQTTGTVVAVTGDIPWSRALDVPNSAVAYYLDRDLPIPIVMKSDNGTTYSFFEDGNVDPQGGVPLIGGAVCGRDSNTGGDGDVLWTSSEWGGLWRYYRSGGLWVVDEMFRPPSIPASSLDYVEIDTIGDVIVCMNPHDGVIYMLNGSSGQAITMYSPPGEANQSALYSDLVVVPSSNASGAIYYTMPAKAHYGKLHYDLSEANLQSDRFLFLYALGTGKFAMGDVSEVWANLEIQLPPGYTTSGVYLNTTPCPYQYYRGWISINLWKDSPITEDLIVVIEQMPSLWLIY